MSYDRVSLYSSGSATTGSSAPKKASSAGSGLTSLATEGVGLGTASAVSSALQYGPHPLMRKWGENFTNWSTRTALADMADNTIFRKKSMEKAAAAGLHGSPWSYSGLLQLGDEAVQINKFSVGGFTNAVRNNIAPLRQSLSQGNGVLRPGVSVGGWLKNTVVGENIKPIQDLVKNGKEARIGSALGRIVGLGYIGTTIVKEGKAAYEQAKAQEDGSFGSRLRTFASTGFAMAKQAVKSAASWEVGGLGFAIGKALLPVAIGGLPVGGILVGALAGALAHGLLEKVSPSVRQEDHGKSAPEATESPPASERRSNPFATVSV